MARSPARRAYSAACSAAAGACPDQVVGGLGVVHIPAAPGQRGQHAARLGVQFLAVGLGNRVVDGVADHFMPEPVLTGARGLEETGVASGG
jgi:hypothetical protein